MIAIMAIMAIILLTIVNVRSVRKVHKIHHPAGPQEVHPSLDALAGQEFSLFLEIYWT